MKQFTEDGTVIPPSPEAVTSSVPGAVQPSGTSSGHEPPEVRAAKELARRYRLQFVDLLPTDEDSPVDYSLFNEIPVDLMVRHQFLPLKRDSRGLHLAMADPTDL